MTQDCPDLQRLGQVPPPPPAVLAAARETLWSAIADEMLATANPLQAPKANRPSQADRSRQAEDQ